MTKKAFISILIALIACTAVFASGAREKLVDFQSVNMETESIENITKTWDAAADYYNESVESLQNVMAEAYAERNVKEYTECRELLRSLVAPVVTEEQTQTLMARMENATEEEKAAIVSFLSSNSRFYRAPRVVFYYEYHDDNRTSSYKNVVSRNPGETITAPTCSAGEGKFLGWSTTADGDVVYKAGDEITMPYADTTYYAIFTPAIRFVDPVSETESYVEGSAADLPEVEEKDGLYFSGWYDCFGNLQEEAIALEEGESGVYTAGWQGLAIDSVEEATVQANRRLRFNYTLCSTGNVSIRDIEVTLAETDGLDIKGSDTQTARRLGSGSALRGTYEIVVSGESGSVIETVLTVTDADGHEWTQPLVLTIK